MVIREAVEADMSRVRELQRESGQTLQQILVGGGYVTMDNWFRAQKDAVLNEIFNVFLLKQPFMEVAGGDLSGVMAVTPDAIDLRGFTLVTSRSRVHASVSLGFNEELGITIIMVTTATVITTDGDSRLELASMWHSFWSNVSLASWPTPWHCWRTLVTT